MALGPADVTFDVATAGMGWMYFSHGGWHWPLTTNPNYGGNIANSLMFSDSVPAFSLPVKVLLGGILDGRPSQILGLSLLFCLVMQSTMAYALISRWTTAAGVAFFGTFLFVGAPVLLLRWNIMSLFWQWLVLAALLLISTSVSLPRRVVLWCLLVVLSTGITAYVAAMYLVLGGADLLVRALVERNWRLALGGYAALLASVPLGLYVWGAFEIPLGSGSAGGLGEYSADVLALVDSQGLSRFFQDLPGGGAGENYAFVGFGVIGLLVAGLAVAIHQCSGPSDAWTRFTASAVSRPEVIAIAGASLVLAMVSLLPDPAVAGHRAGIDLPEELLRLLSTFRANGRFMWPLMYSTILLSVVLGSRVVRFSGASLVAFAVVLQYVDQAPVFRYVTTHVQQSVSASAAPQPLWTRFLGHRGSRRSKLCPPTPIPGMFLGGRSAIRHSEPDFPCPAWGTSTATTPPRLPPCGCPVPSESWTATSAPARSTSSPATCSTKPFRGGAGLRCSRSSKVGTWFAQFRRGWVLSWACEPSAGGSPRASDPGEGSVLPSQSISSCCWSACRDRPGHLPWPSFGALPRPVVAVRSRSGSQSHGTLPSRSAVAVCSLVSTHVVDSLVVGRPEPHVGGDCHQQDPTGTKAPEDLPGGQ